MVDNQIVIENQKQGTPQSVWDAPGSNQIEGFAADISYDIGQTVDLKININTATPDSALPRRNLSPRLLRR